jgi:hypothetical protein
MKSLLFAHFHPFLYSQPILCVNINKLKVVLFIKWRYNVSLVCQSKFYSKIQRRRRWLRFWIPFLFRFNCATSIIKLIFFFFQFPEFEASCENNSTWGSLETSSQSTKIQNVLLKIHFFFLYLKLKNKNGKFRPVILA